MDFNSLLIWIAAPSCLIIVIQSLRASPKLKGWLFVSLALPAVSAIVFWLRPEIAGFVTGILWALFILGPSLTQWFTRRYVAQQKYERAAIPARIASILHPFDGMPQLSRFLGAMSLAEQGKTAEAIVILNHLEATAVANMSRLAAVHSRRLGEDWVGLIAWVDSNIEPRRLVREMSILPMYVRALGETGQLGSMLRWVALSKLPHNPQLAIFRTMPRMFAFAFSGQPAQVEAAFDGPLSVLPDAVKRYWIATGKFAAGLSVDAHRDLDLLEPSASPGLKLSIQSRRAKPPAVASSIFTETDLQLLSQLDHEQDHERRFSYSVGHGPRPWVTIALILANLLMFAGEWALGAGPGNWQFGGTSSEAVLHRLGAMEPDILQTQQYYRLFQANFLHYGYLHILMNMLALWVLGPFVEFNLGRVQYALLYLISGVAVMCTVLFLQLHHWMEPEMLVGASGAIMAIIGATCAILLRGWFREGANSARRRLQPLLLIIVLQVVFDHFTPQVSGAAHVAGIAWGFVLASILPHRKAKPL